ncbi:hypothetical protein ACJO15_10485 [Vibrio parahaemolyticus]|uniref:hypothetical protein n=1 Tax=Vibrio parahaemolyticus TaxID=670 RepID=UPI000414E303|nr:hypothetical protein [Vibrio parahaemolyticus]MBE4469687.1 hypothetical protein [Vibrio parahaemolyticus]MEA5296405.1 hypothetical protein [Vibrio parahaemolyticus]
MDKEKLEYKILCASFFMALVSFIYSSVDFYSQYNEKYELSIVSSKTKSGSNDNEFRSEFVLSNTGNRTLFVLDSWISLEIEKAHIEKLKKSKRNEALILSYIKDVNLSNFSREVSSWESIELAPNSSKLVNILGEKKYNVLDYYELMPSKSIEVENVLDDLVHISSITEMGNDHDLLLLQQRGSKFATLYLNFKLQLENNEVAYVKWPYDYVVSYRKSSRDPAPISYQIKSYYPRLTSVMKINVLKNSTHEMYRIEI